MGPRSSVDGEVLENLARVGIRDGLLDLNTTADGHPDRTHAKQAQGRQWNNAGITTDSTTQRASPQPSEDHCCRFGGGQSIRMHACAAQHASQYCRSSVESQRGAFLTEEEEEESGSQPDTSTTPTSIPNRSTTNSKRMMGTPSFSIASVSSPTTTTTAQEQSQPLVSRKGGKKKRLLSCLVKRNERYTFATVWKHPR